MLREKLSVEDTKRYILLRFKVISRPKRKRKGGGIYINVGW
jgi:hypothetical protein